MKARRATAVMLSDALLDLDQPVTVVSGGQEPFRGSARRTIKSLHDTLASRGDREMVFDAAVTVALPAGAK